MGVQESLNQVIAELVNRRIQLKQVGDPNLASSLDGALVGTTYLQLDATPRVIWRKERTGANGWDIEQVLPIQPEHYRYVDQFNTAPGQNGSFENPFSSLQDAYDSIPSAVDAADFNIVYTVYILSEYEETANFTLPTIRSVMTHARKQLKIIGDVTVSIDGDLPIWSTLNTSLCVGFYSDYKEVPGGGNIPELLQIQIWGNFEVQVANIIPDPAFVSCEFVFRGVSFGYYAAHGAIRIPDWINDPAWYVDGNITINQCSIFGTDIGGGVHKSIDAPHFEIIGDESSCTSLVDADAVIGQLLSMRGGLTVANGSMAMGPLKGLHATGILGAYISAGSYLPLDEESKATLFKALRSGSLTFSAPVPILQDLDMYFYRNSDVDIATSPEVVDQFPYALACCCTWEVLVKRGTTQFRRGSITAVWTADGLSINTQGETKLAEVGLTSDLSLSVDINASNVRLRATAVNTDNWSVTVRRIMMSFNPS